MSQYKLNYFNGRGRAELVRLVFAEAGVSYEDNRIEQSAWPTVKASGCCPFGQLPTLEVDGMVFAQSNAIARFVARECKLYGTCNLDGLKIDQLLDELADVGAKIYAWLFAGPETKAALGEELANNFLPLHVGFLVKLLSGGDYFLASGFSVADLAIMNSISTIVAVVPGFSNIEGADKLMALADRVQNRPNVAKWIAERPQTAF
eukprot:ANDGO_01978.mRNA.1 putative glutathione S-transferase 5